MTTNYQKFYNPPTYTSENGSATDPPAYPAFQVRSSNPSPAAIINGQSAPVVQQPRKELKSRNSLRRLIRVELILALAMIFLEAIMDGVSATMSMFHPGMGACAIGTGIWVGILGVIAAGLGWGAFRSPYGNKCMMVANFVMSIICAVADGIMIVFSGICLGTFGYVMRGTYQWNSHTQRGEFKDPSPETVALGRGLMATESFLLLAAITHMISSIVSTAFICRNWCQDSQPAVAVVYFPGTSGVNQPNVVGNESTTDPCRIAVPSGAHVQQYVIFVPMGNGGQAVFPPVAVPQQQPPPQPEFRNVPPQSGLGDEKRV